jgi:hypothetical protein
VRVNDLRKRLDLELDARIDLTIEAGGELGQVVDVHGDWIAAEVLAVSLQRGETSTGEEIALGDETARVAIEVVR